MRMRKSKVYQAVCNAAVFSLLGVVMGSCAQTSHPASPKKTNAAGADKVVLKVGATQVTQSDIDFVMQSLSPQAREQVASQGRRSIGDQYATLLVLSQAAQSSHLDSSRVFQKAMEQRREQLLASLEYHNLASKAVVTPAEVNQYYSAHTSEFHEAQIREVAIRKAGSNTGTPGLSPQAAQVRAEAIRKALASGQDAAKVARDFGVPNEVIVDAQPRTIQNDPTLPAFVKTAFQLKNGELSPIQDTPNAIVFFQVVAHPVIALQQAAPEIENALRQQRVDAAVENLKKQTTIWMDQDYFSQQPSSASSKP